MVIGIKEERKYIQNGYVFLKNLIHPKSSKRDHLVREHVLYAEKVLGKPLPLSAVVHHVNGDTTKQKGNLVICENQGYHFLLHRRKQALNASGHANWLKCCYCHQYDNPENLTRSSKSTNYHRHCLSDYHKCCYLKRNHEYKRGPYHQPKQGNLIKMAKEVGISKSHLSNILARRRVPSAKVAQRLYFITSVPMETWLLPDKYPNAFINKLIREKRKRKEGRKTKPATTKL